MYAGGEIWTAGAAWHALSWISAAERASDSYRPVGQILSVMAHAHPPNMGEGGCMAIEDAVVLAEELRAADSVESALDWYVTKRRPRVDWVHEQSQVAADGWVLPPALRDAALRERGDQIFRDRYQRLFPTLAIGCGSTLPCSSCCPCSASWAAGPRSTPADRACRD
jgi:FAD binding domain-containing protein